MLYDKVRNLPADRQHKVLNEKINQTAIITFNRPQRMNSLSDDMMHKLLVNLNYYEEDYDTDLVILKGQGQKAFSAGGDLLVIYSGIKVSSAPASYHRGLDTFYRVFHKLSRMKKPTVSIMDGFTIGAGAATAFNSNFRIATENTIMLMPETTIGHFIDCSTSYFLSRLKGHYGRYISLCSIPIKAEEVMLAGISTHYVPSWKINTMINHLTQLKSPSLKVIDATINQYAEKCPASQTSLTADMSKEQMRTIINDCFKFDTVEEIINALEDEGSEFSKQAKNCILKASPTALKTSLELLRRASTLSLMDCIILERRLWSLDMVSHDFREGCRAKLSKQIPKWHPSQLKDVDLVTDICLNRFTKSQSLEPLYFSNMKSSLEKVKEYKLSGYIKAGHSIQNRKSNL